MATAAANTEAPGRYVVLYDGQCKFCTAGAKRLTAWMRSVPYDLANFHKPGLLDRFPGISHEACMERLHLVTPAGKVYGGVEAIVHALETVPLIGQLTLLYYIPGVRQLLDVFYEFVAAHRYRIMGKAIAAGECDGGTCAVHFGDAASRTSSHNAGRSSSTSRPSTRADSRSVSSVK